MPGRCSLSQLCSSGRSKSRTISSSGGRRPGRVAPRARRRGMRPNAVAAATRRPPRSAARQSRRTVLRSVRSDRNHPRDRPAGSPPPVFHRPAVGPRLADRLAGLAWPGSPRRPCFSGSFGERVRAPARVPASARCRAPLRFRCAGTVASGARCRYGAVLVQRIGQFENHRRPPSPRRLASVREGPGNALFRVPSSEVGTGETGRGPGATGTPGLAVLSR